MLLSQVIRDGEPLSIKWGWWHIECLTKLAKAEVGIPTMTPLLDAWSDPRMPGTHTVRHGRTFVDWTDGEVFTLQPGDIINMWRNR